MPLPTTWASLSIDVAATCQSIEARIPDHRDVYPPAPLRFRAFEAVAPAQVRVVILGMDPYPTQGHACGLSFSVPTGVAKLPPTLKNIIKEFEADQGVALPTTDFTAWAEQGVLLANAALSVHGKPGSHSKLWVPFTEAWIRALQSLEQPCVWVLWGNDAQAFRPLITGQKQRIIATPHPSPLAAYRGFFGSRPFSRCNELLSELDCPPIRWLGPRADGPAQPQGSRQLLNS